MGADMWTHMRRLFAGIFKAPNGLGRLILAFALTILVFVVVELATGELIAGLLGAGFIVLLLALALVSQQDYEVTRPFDSQLERFWATPPAQRRRLAPGDRVIVLGFGLVGHHGTLVRATRLWWNGRKAWVVELDSSKPPGGRRQTIGEWVLVPLEGLQEPMSE